MSTSPSLSTYVWRYTGAIVPGLICVLVSAGLDVAIPFITRFAIDDLVAGDIRFQRLLAYAGLYAGASLVSAVFALVTRRLILNMSHRVGRDIRRDVFQNLTELDYPFYSRQRIGDIMNRMTSDLRSVREFIGYGIHQGARTLIGFTFAFSAMFLINVRLALIMLVLLPCISILAFAVLGVLRRRHEQAQEQFSHVTNFTQETFSGIRTIKGFGAEERQRLSFRDLNRHYIDLKMAQGRVEAPIWPMMGLLFSLGVLLLLWAGGRQVIQGDLSLGEFVQFIQYLNLLQWPMIALGWTLGLIQRGLASWGRLVDLLEAQPAIRLEQGGRERCDLTGEVVFENVSLRLENRPILSDVSLVVSPGRTLGITGPTGSGKTLLASLLVRLLDPTEGRILIGGRDLRDIPLDRLRDRIGVAPQEPFLFSDTLANNIAFGLDESNDEQIIWAADVAQLRMEAELFPQGFQTLLGERGVTLSGGQRQRTAISRAIAKHPDILILDDIFSAIDTHTESKILDQLLPLLRQRTSILISHRVTTLRHADRIIVVEDGRITQEGSHDELVGRPGYYRELDEMQRLEARLEAG